MRELFKLRANLLEFGCNAPTTPILFLAQRFLIMLQNGPYSSESIFMAGSRPSHCIKINVRYRETLASATDCSDKCFWLSLRQFVRRFSAPFAHNMAQLLCDGRSCFSSPPFFYQKLIVVCMLFVANMYFHGWFDGFCVERLHRLLAMRLK